MKGECTGKDSSYRRGCRCDKCREAHRLVKNAATKAAKEQKSSGATCTQSARGYKAGCRCAGCVEAMRKEWRNPPASNNPGTHFTSAQDYAEAKRVAQQLKAKGFRHRAARVLLNIDGRWPAPGDLAR